jgi:hypothetical protein
MDHLAIYNGSARSALIKPALRWWFLDSLVLRSVLSALCSPLCALRSVLSALGSRFSALGFPLCALRSPLCALRSPLSTIGYIQRKPIMSLAALHHPR